MEQPKEESTNYEENSFSESSAPEDMQMNETNESNPSVSQESSFESVHVSSEPAYSKEPEQKAELKEEQKPEVKPVEQKVETKEPAYKPSPEKSQEGSASSAGLWRFVALLAIAALVVSVFTGGFSFSKSGTPTGAVTVDPESASSTVLDLVNTQLLPPGVSAELMGVTEENGLYAVTLIVADQEVTSYLTKDGAVFFPQGINLDEVEELFDAPVELEEPTLDSSDTLPGEETNLEEEAESNEETSVEVETSEDSDPNAITIDLDDSDDSESETTTIVDGKISVTAKKFRFVPSEITVKTGETVTLSLTSTDVEHSFILDEFNILETIPAGQTIEVEFTPDKTGTFEFSSGSNEAMIGQLIVE